MTPSFLINIPPTKTPNKVANNPKILTVVIDNPHEIARRLAKRDGKIYTIEDLNMFQNMEIEYAKYLSEKYSIPYIEIKNGEFNQLLKLI